MPTPPEKVRLTAVKNRRDGPGEDDTREEKKKDC